MMKNMTSIEQYLGWQVKIQLDSSSCQDKWYCSTHLEVQPFLSGLYFTPLTNTIWYKKNLSQVIYEGFIVPHVLLRQVRAPLTIFVFCLMRNLIMKWLTFSNWSYLNSIVTQVDALMEVVNLEWLWAKSGQLFQFRFDMFWHVVCCDPCVPEVWRLIHPDDQGVPVSHQHPLPDVKLGVVNQHRSLNVLLDHEPEKDMIRCFFF